MLQFGSVIHCSVFGYFFVLIVCARVKATKQQKCRSMITNLWNITTTYSPTWQVISLMTFFMTHKLKTNKKEKKKKKYNHFLNDCKLYMWTVLKVIWYWSLNSAHCTLNADSDEKKQKTKKIQNLIRTTRNQWYICKLKCDWPFSCVKQKQNH